MRAALILLTLLLPSLSAAAPRRWAIAEIDVEGDVDAAIRADVEERAWRALSLALPTDALLAPHDAVAAALAAAPALRGCSDDRCSLALGDRLGVDRLITVRIERHGADWTARLLAFAVDAAEVAGTLEQPCAGCSVDALLDAFTRAATPLLRDDRPRPLCRLAVSAPAGATVSVDTVTLGGAPFVHTVAAGHHTVAISAPVAQTEVDCPAGGERQLHLGGSAAPPSSRRAWQLGLGAGAGVLALGSLAGLITAAAYDNRASCAGRCAYKYDTTTGIALGAVGVGLFGAAAAALFATLHHPAAAHAALVPTLGGAAVVGGF